MSQGNFSNWNNLTTTNLGATGALNFGEGAYTQATSNTTTVATTSSSGVITTHGTVAATTTVTFGVTNPNVTTSSVILLSPGQTAQSTLDSGTLFAANPCNQTNGSFSIALTNDGTSASTHTISCGYLIC